jgi:hypothetical protein
MTELIYVQNINIVYYFFSHVHSYIPFPIVKSTQSHEMCNVWLSFREFSNYFVLQLR